jgi:hypothetical protein
LDANFWKKLGVLPLLDRLDETGKIQPLETVVDEEDGSPAEAETKPMTGTPGSGDFFGKQGKEI